MAAAGELSTATPAEQTDTHHTTAATSPVPLHALSRLDTQSLAAQEMSEQELKAVEGGTMPGFTLPAGDGWVAFGAGIVAGFYYQEGYKAGCHC